MACHVSFFFTFRELDLSVCAVCDSFPRILLLNKYLPHMPEMITFILDMNQKEITITSDCIIHEIIKMIHSKS